MAWDRAHDEYSRLRPWYAEAFYHDATNTLVRSILKYLKNVKGTSFSDFPEERITLLRHNLHNLVEARNSMHQKDQELENVEERSPDLNPDAEYDLLVQRVNDSLLQSS